MSIATRLLLLCICAGALDVVPLVPLALLLAIGYGLLAGSFKRPFREPAKWFALYAGLSLLYCALIGVHLYDLVLYRRELKYLFPFGAFLTLSSFRFPSGIGRQITGLLMIIAVVSATFFLLTIPLAETDLSPIYLNGGSMWEVGNTAVPVYLGQFLTHSAAGGFFCTLGLLLLGPLLAGSESAQMKRKLFACVIACMTLLVMTRSRAFLLADLSVVLVALGSRRLPKGTMSRLVAIGLVVAAPIVSYSVLTELQSHNVVSLVTSDENSRDYNIAARYVLWGKAVADFMASPFLGIGISRFDDEATVLFTMPGGAAEYSGAPIKPRTLPIPLLQINVDSFQAHTDQHAHNNYLDVLAEGGLLFFGLFLFMYWRTFRKLAFLSEAGPHEDRGLAKGAYLALWGVAIGSFFGDNLFSIIPMFTLLSIIGYLCAERVGSVRNGS